MFKSIGSCERFELLFEFKNNLKVYDGQLEDFNFDFINHEPNACPEIKFLYLEIENEVNSYKDYLASYFEDLPNKRVNFFTDVSNYVSYELGQPSHCYDFSSLQGTLELKKIDKKKDFMTCKKIKLSLMRVI